MCPRRNNRVLRGFARIFPLDIYSNLHAPPHLLKCRERSQFHAMGLEDEPFQPGREDSISSVLAMCWNYLQLLRFEHGHKSRIGSHRAFAIPHRSALFPWMLPSFAVVMSPRSCRLFQYLPSSGPARQFVLCASCSILIRWNVVHRIARF